MFKMVFLSAILINLSMATTINTQIFENIKIRKNSVLSKKGLYVIGVIKSNNKPLLITLNTLKELKPSITTAINSAEAEYTIKDVSDYLSYIEIYPKSKDDAIKIAINLHKLSLNFNAGIAQINSKEIDIKEIDYIFDIDYNFNKVNARFTECKIYFKDIADIYECYNSSIEAILKDNSFKFAFDEFKKNYKTIWEEDFK